MKKIIIPIVIIIVILMPFLWYHIGVGAKNKSGDVVRIVVEDGMNSSDIIKALKDGGAIRSKLAAKIYMKLNTVGTLKAGKYDISTSENFETIIKHIENGEVADDRVKLTLIEGKNIRWLAKKIGELTDNTEEDVYTLLADEEYIDSLIEKYWFITDDVKNEDIYYPLEGYLLPDTYIFEERDVSVKEIFNVILNFTEKSMNNFKDEIEERNLNVHEILTLASMAELEGEAKEDRAEIVGVFINRVNKKMSLGSDVTTYYAFKVDMSERNLTKKELNTENPYNTRGPGMSGKIPVGPICNPSVDAIDATIHFTETENLYFVADKNGKVYFSSSNAEHEKTIKKLKNEGLWFSYE